MLDHCICTEEEIKTELRIKIENFLRKTKMYDVEDQAELLEVFLKEDFVPKK